MKFKTSFTLILLASLLVALFSLARVPAAHAAQAQTLTVTDCSSDSQLQADITTANSDNADDTITFSCSGDIKLSSTLNISGSMTLYGGGQSITLDGQNQVRVLLVNSSVNFTLNALTVAHGSALPSGGFCSSAEACSGGALENDANGTVSITNSTIADNSASASGGGLDNPGVASITNSTIVDNSAAFPGGLASDLSGTINIRGSIVADNLGGNCDGGHIFSFDYNLQSGTECLFFKVADDLQNTDPQLDPNGLQNNGGPTQTIVLQATSPAIDHIPAATCPATDQRGVTRLPGERCDIGAFEFPDTTAPTLHLPGILTADATSPAGAAVPYTATATDDDGDPLVATCSLAQGSTFPIGTTTVNCSASEPGSNTASGNFQVVVKPVLTANGMSVSTTEGSAASLLVASGTAYGTSNPLSATINWGDGSSSTISVSPASDGSFSVTGSHTYAEEGSFDLTVQVSASGGHSATATGKAAVADAPLIITKQVVGVTGKGLAGLAATFTDADPAGTVSDYSGTISWGDGTTSEGSIAKNPIGAGFVVAGAHQYAKAGTYTVTLTIHDGGGSSVTGTQTLVVP